MPRAATTAGDRDLLPGARRRRSGGNGGLPGHLPGRARRSDRKPLPSGRRVQDPRDGGELRCGVAAVHAILERLGRAAAGFVADRSSRSWPGDVHRPGRAGVHGSARRWGAAGGGLVCSQRFVLTQNDRIGALVIKKGRYIIDRLGPLSPSCAQAGSLLGGFLTDFDGVLSNSWVLLANDATFVRGSVSYGFRLEPDPDQGGGGHRFPTQTTRCAATFRVVRDERIGALAFPAGPYWVSIYKGSNITCPQATQLFASFLQRTDGRLPSPWVINVATGSFRRGTANPYGFLAKPAFNAT